MVEFELGSGTSVKIGVGNPTSLYKNRGTNIIIVRKYKSVKLKYK